MNTDTKEVMLTENSVVVTVGGGEGWGEGKDMGG